LSLFAFIPLVHVCSGDKDPVTPENVLIVKTIDGYGNPVPSTIVYESRDCEYDFSAPLKASSDALGTTVLKVPAGYLQLYAEGFVNESYRCFTYSGNTETITIYGKALPTFIQTTPHTSITYAPNRGGNCDYENLTGTTIVSDSTGKATIFFPFQDIYKIQANGKAECFQPEQEVRTIVF
ncbi:MAG: hypothetical protein H7259_00305, partial [Cytophagales bacterium]|nr:hypothetical protein [Cytophaga sp.]